MSQTRQYVVVIGAARSGTKFVRDLIGASTGCCHVPYDVNYVWRTGNGAHPDDALPPETCTPAIARRIDRILQKLSGWRPHRADWIVEKTVSNCVRVSFIDNVFPETRYIHLIRDGRDVVESSFRQWNAPVSLRYALKKLRYLPLRNVGYAFFYALNMLRGRLSGRRGVGVWGVRYPGIEEEMKTKSVLEICARQWERCVVTANRDFQKIPSERQLVVRYEKLVNDIGEVERIARFLNLPDKKEMKNYYQNHLRKGPQRVWQDRFDKEVWEQVLAIITPQLESLGYTDPSTRRAA